MYKASLGAWTKRDLASFTDDELDQEGRNLNAIRALARFPSFDQARHNLNPLGQRVGHQVGVTLGHRDVEVAQKLLHLIKARPLVDEEACIGVAQVVDAHIGQARALADPLP